MKTYQILLFTAFVMFASCKGMNDNIEEYLNRGELNYLGRPDSAYVLGGNERVNIVWKINDDPRITSATITWNDLDNNEQHQDYTINRSALVNGYAIIPLAIPEGTYVFKIVHTGASENVPSIETEVSGISYGESYLTSMRNIGFINVATRFGNGLIMQWSNTNGLICDLSYTDVNDQKKTLAGITDFTKAIIISDFKSDLSYSMTVLPAADALDKMIVTDNIAVNYKNYTLSAAAPAIVPIVDFDLGGEGVAFHDTDSGNNGGMTYRTDNGDPDGNAVDVEGGNSPNIGYTNAGEWLNYTVYVQDEGYYIADMNAAVNGGSAVSFLVDGVKVVENWGVTNDGSWGDYSWRNEKNPDRPKAILNLTKGYHTITFFEETGGYNVRYLSFTYTTDIDEPEPEPVSVTGSWLFEDAGNIGKASVGQDLVLVGDGFESVDGPSASNRAVRVPLGSYFRALHGIAANGNGSRVNNYTLMIDFKIAEIGIYHSIYQSTLENNDDAEFFINRNGQFGIGSTGYSEYTCPTNEWHRLVISAKMGDFYEYYIDGTRIHQGTPSAITTDSRFSWLPEGVLLFADDGDEDNEIDVAEIMIWDGAMTSNEISALGTVQ